MHMYQVPRVGRIRTKAAIRRFNPLARSVTIIFHIALLHIDRYNCRMTPLCDLSDLRPLSIFRLVFNRAITLTAGFGWRQVPYVYRCNRNFISFRKPLNDGFVVSFSNRLSLQHLAGFVLSKDYRTNILTGINHFRQNVNA